MAYSSLSQSTMSSGLVVGEASITFTDSDVLLVTVTAASVTPTSTIIAYVSRAEAGRDVDEMEMEAFTTAVTAVATGTFDAVIANETGGAEGTYILSYVIA